MFVVPKFIKLTYAMDMATQLCCTIFGHNFSLVKSKNNKSINCKSCDSNFTSNLFEDTNLLNDVQLEMKQAIRELFLITHRRRRALQKS